MHPHKAQRCKNTLYVHAIGDNAMAHHSWLTIDFRSVHVLYTRSIACTAMQVAVSGLCQE